MKTETVGGRYRPTRDLRNQRVRVLYGRWAGRVGVQTGEHWSWTNPQPQGYPVVRLDATTRAKARTVRVLAVEPEVH